MFSVKLTAKKWYYKTETFKRQKRINALKQNKNDRELKVSFKQKENVNDKKVEKLEWTKTGTKWKRQTK